MRLCRTDLEWTPRNRGSFDTALFEPATFIYIYTHTHTHIHTYIICIFEYIYTHIYTYIYIYTYLIGLELYGVAHFFNEKR